MPARPRRLPRSATLVAALAMIAAGCDLLSTRTPEQPQRQSNFLPPTTPDVVLGNFENAIDARDAVSYTRCFVDTTRLAYRFTPGADAQQYATRFAGWSVRDEAAYFNNLRAQVPAGNTLAVFLDSVETVTTAPDSAVFSASYTLVAQHTDPSRPTSVHGRMYLTVKPDPLTQQWAVSQWVDVATPPDPSWSILKARFAP